MSLLNFNLIFFELRLSLGLVMTFELRLASQPYILLVMITSLRYVLSVFVVVRSLGVGCSR